MSKLLYFLSFLLPLAAQAHVGSPNVFYEGLAGPDHLRVVIRPPGVVPGRAEISVRVIQGEVRRITVLPVHWNAGKKGAPPPDEAKLVRGETNLYSAELWLMTAGAHSIFVEAEGGAGAGTTVVPLNSVATTRLAMPPVMGGAMLAMGIFLFAALVSIVGAAVRESVLPPGAEPDRRRLWWARGAMAAGFLLLASGLYGGRIWWNAVDSDHRNNKIFKPDPITASVRSHGAQRVLRLERLEQKGGFRPLVPDHGKLMHVFLVRAPDMDGFAHLHPARVKAHVYEAPLPELPHGLYKVYADITLESGFTQTLMAEITLTKTLARADAEEPAVPSDPDDSWHAGGPAAPAKERAQVETALLPKGFRMVWERPDTILENRESSLRFKVLTPDGQPAKLEPYMDMPAHAAIRRDDGAVFTHLHPFGTISMASQQLFVKRENTRQPGSPLEVMCGLPPKEDAVAFPYEFPKPGRYRIWVQVRISGEIVTGVFEAEVRPSKT